MDPTQSFNTTTTSQRKERLECDSASSVSRNSIQVKRTELTSYLLVRKLARRGSAEGYRTNRSRIYWYNSSESRRLEDQGTPCVPTLALFCWVCLFYPHPHPVMLSALSLLSSFSFLLVVPVFSISLSRHRFLSLDPCFLRRHCLARFTTERAVVDMAQAKET